MRRACHVSPRAVGTGGDERAHNGHEPDLRELLAQDAHVDSECGLEEEDRKEDEQH